MDDDWLNWLTMRPLTDDEMAGPEICCGRRTGSILSHCQHCPRLTPTERATWRKLHGFAPAASRTPIGEATVGRYFIDEQGEVWRQVAYTSQPTAMLQRVQDETPFVPAGHDSPRCVSGVVGSPLLERFRLLVPEGETTDG